MGLLVIDHSAGQGLDGRQGVKQEMETKSCHHCGSLIAILARPKEHLHISCADMGLAATQAPHVTKHEYTARHRCNRCRKDICRACAANGVCAPFAAKIEHAVQRQRWDEHFAYQFKQCLGAR